MNKKALLYKYAKRYSYIIKQATKQRNYNYVPKNSVLSNVLANNYWKGRDSILNQPNLTPNEQARQLALLRMSTRSSINMAQYPFTVGADKAYTFGEGLHNWWTNTAINTLDRLKPLANSGPLSRQSANDLARKVYKDHTMASRWLVRDISAATTAENAFGLVTPYIENPQVREYINTIPRKFVGFNNNYNQLTPTAAGHYDMYNGEMLLERGTRNPHTPIHEAMHAVQAVTPNASNRDIQNWLNYTKDKSKLNEYYSYVDNNGNVVTVPKAQAAYAIESGANQLVNDYIHKATENLPRRMRNTIRRSMAIEGAASDGRYLRSLGIDPNAEVHDLFKTKKFIKAINAAARMTGVNAKKELGMEDAKNILSIEPLLDRSLKILKANGYDISPEMEAEIRRGYMLSRKSHHNSIKQYQRSKWNERVKSNPALLEKAKRLGRIVKVGHYKRMYKIFKRALLQSI